MSEAALDPYALLGVAPEISDIELRRAYRELVKRHHPDHNGGSAESARRFAQIQNAYAAIAQLRRDGGANAAAASAASGAQAQPAPDGDPDIESRITMMEREMVAAHAEQARLAAQQAEREREQAARLAAARRAEAAQAFQRQAAARPTPEELGYYSTDDSFTKIIDDATEQFGERLRKSDAKKQFTRRLSDLFGRDL